MKKSNCDPVKPPYSVLNDLPLEKQHPALKMKARQGSLFTESKKTIFVTFHGACWVRITLTTVYILLKAVC